MEINSNGCFPHKCNSLPETNRKLAPGNGWLEDDTCFVFWVPRGLFSGAKLLLVSGSVRSVRSKLCSRVEGKTM